MRWIHVIGELGETICAASHRVTFRITVDDLTHMLEKIVRRKGVMTTFVGQRRGLLWCVYWFVRRCTETMITLQHYFSANLTCFKRYCTVSWRLLFLPQNGIEKTTWSSGGRGTTKTVSQNFYKCTPHRGSHPKISTDRSFDFNLLNDTYIRTLYMQYAVCSATAIGTKQKFGARLKTPLELHYLTDRALTCLWQVDSRTDLIPSGVSCVLLQLTAGIFLSGGKFCCA